MRPYLLAEELISHFNLKPKILLAGYWIFCQIGHNVWESMARSHPSHSLRRVPNWAVPFPRCFSFSMQTLVGVSMTTGISYTEAFKPLWDWVQCCVGWGYNLALWRLPVNHCVKIQRHAYWLWKISTWQHTLNNHSGQGGRDCIRIQIFGECQWLSWVFESNTDAKLSSFKVCNVLMTLFYQHFTASVPTYRCVAWFG